MFTIRKVAEQVIHGFLRASATDGILSDANASASQSVVALTYLAGGANAPGTRYGIRKAVAAASREMGNAPRNFFPQRLRLPALLDRARLRVAFR